MPKPLVTKDTLDLMTRVSVLVGGLGKGTDERPGHDLQLLALFDRCRSLLGAIRLLLAYNFVHEAVMLGRPLFADSLALAEFATLEENGRAELVIRRERAGLADLDGIYFEARSRGDDVTEELAQLAGWRSDLDEYARRRGLTNTRAWRADDHTKELADKHGRGDEYVALRITHHFVHGSAMATSQRYSKTAEDTVEVGGPAAKLKEWADDAGLFASYSTLHAARAVSRIFEWTEPPELDELFQKIEARISMERLNG